MTVKKAKKKASSLKKRVSAAVKSRVKKAKQTVRSVFKLRTDLPVVPMQGGEKVGLLRVMNGLTTSKTYLTVAEKGINGIIAVRDFGPGYTSCRYNVKFYPNFAHWGYDRNQLQRLGANCFLSRPEYDRMHVTEEQLNKLLADVHSQQQASRKPENRLRALLATPLLKAFGQLSKWRQQVSVQ